MKPLNWFTALMFFGVLQGSVLIIAINQLPKRNKVANRILSIFILFIIFTLLWRMNKVLGTVTLMGVIQDILLFSYGPLFYFYTKSLLTTEKITFKKWRTHLLPTLLYIVLLIPMLYAPKFWFFLFMLTAVLAVVHSTTYLVKSYQLIIIYKKKTSSNGASLKYLQTILVLLSICLIAALYALILYLLKLPYHLTFFNYHVSGIVASFVTCALGYFAILSPEIFRLPADEMMPPSLPVTIKKPTKKAIKQPDLQTWKNKLEQVMETSQLYLNPELTLSDLAQEMQMDKVLTSRVIHEGFELNFYDFINTYRIEHFVKLSQDKNYQHYTSLALAYESGFNAKSTFHKVFKRIKAATPTAYLKSLNHTDC